MPGKAKKKTAKKRSGASKKRAKSTAKSKPKKPAAKAKKKTAKAKPKPAAFGTGRRSTNREIRERREWVSRLYIVRRWKLLQILPKYEEQFGCGLETLKKDITEIRKQFKDAKKKGEGSLDEILHEITEGKDERKRILWNELAKIDEGEKLLSARREMYEKRLDLPDQDYVSIGKIIADIDKQLGVSLTKKLKLVKELREHDDSFSDSIRKLGITAELGDVSDIDEIITSIIVRRKKVEEQKKSNTPAPGGGNVSAGKQ